MSAQASTSPTTLLLFPTELEHRRFLDQGGQTGATESICGFGVAASGARTMQLLHALRPDRVLLVGIAGAYDTERVPVGEALVFDRVGIDGIGAGQGARFQGPAALGFPQWPGDADGPPIEEVLELAQVAVPSDGLLLTTCAASANEAEATDRRTRYPEAVAEDMEGFAVAVACRLARVPLAIVRGISNRVGDRDPRQWRIPGALAAARRRTLDLLAQHAWGTPEDDG